MLGLRVREARGLSIRGGAVGAHDPAGQLVVNRHVGVLCRLGDLLADGLEDVVQLVGIRGGLVVAAVVGAIAKPVPRRGIRIVTGDSVHIGVKAIVPVG